jgi:hypothetical protein
MKTLLKFAIGAAIGSALVRLLMNQRSEKEVLNPEADASAPPLESASAEATAASVDELVGETRGAQNALNS